MRAESRPRRFYRAGVLYRRKSLFRRTRRRELITDNNSAKSPLSNFVFSRSLFLAPSLSLSLARAPFLSRARRVCRPFDRQVRLL